MTAVAAPSPVKIDWSSARHIIRAPSEDLRFGKDGKIYALAPTIIHTKHEHADLKGLDRQWYTFVRNTALRSVSIQGVD